MLSNEFSLPFKEKISYFLTFPDYMMELSPLSNPWMKSFFRDQNTPVYRPRWLPESQDLTSAKVKNQIHRANIALCQNTTVFQEDSDVFWKNKPLLTHSVQDCSQLATLTPKRMLHRLSHKCLMAFRWLCNPIACRQAEFSIANQCSL